MSPNSRQSRRVATLLSTKRSSQVFRDEEFGDIPYRRVARSRYVRVKLATNGSLQATLPMFAPLSSLRQLIDKSRGELRSLTTTNSSLYVDAQRVGHSHTLHFLPNTGSITKGSITGQRIVITHPRAVDPASPDVQSIVRQYVARALRAESKAYLPRRLAHLAAQAGFTYQRVRFAHQSGRWGSCSTSGTISLNIALMNLPFELIDYVLIHELAHTQQMNHSPAFWSIVADYCPGYKTARKILKSHNPYL